MFYDLACIHAQGEEQSVEKKEGDCFLSWMGFGVCNAKRGTMMTHTSLTEGNTQQT